MFKDVQAAIYWLETQIKFTPKMDLKRMRAAVQAMNLDLANKTKIHVAGTNGKGSVTAYLTQIFQDAGYKVGTYTSPYLVIFNERIAINHKMISDEKLLMYANEMYQFNEHFHQTFGEPLPFFELITLIALRYFLDENVDIIIIEVGVGGLLDATNVFNYDVSLITNIGFDHMKQLGSTLESIALNKLGILKPKNHLITTVAKNLQPFFLQQLSQKDVTYQLIQSSDFEILSRFPLCFTYLQKSYELKLLGTYQVSNAVLAIEAVRYLKPEIGLDSIEASLKKTVWPGRLEAIEANVYIDGAHNLPALIALEETFKGMNVHVLFSALQDKDIPAMLNVLERFAKTITMTSFPDPRFAPLNPFETKERHYLPNFFEAFKFVKDQRKPDELILITGSLHFIGYCKQVLK